jgi:hypothetical protein
VVDVTSILGANNGTCTFTFKFMFPKVGQGTYTIKIYAAVSDASESETGPPSELRSSGSMLAESVRLVWYTVSNSDPCGWRGFPPRYFTGTDSRFTNYADPGRSPAKSCAARYSVDRLS